tara:strand:+ start:894 stop:1634 length:741 start_codon:yes stop_codon:yes gene_type:complete
MIQGIADGHDMTSDEVMEVLGLPAGNPTSDHPQFDSLEEMMHDMLDVHTQSEEPSRPPLLPSAPPGHGGAGEYGRPPRCLDSACGDSSTVRFVGQDPDTGQSIFVCDYDGHSLDHVTANAGMEGYDSSGNLWMDSDGNPVLPLEDSGGHDSTDASERGRPMTERGRRRYTNRTGREEDEVRGLAAPLTAGSQGEGRVGPDVMDENQLIRYEAPQLREMIQHISQELARRDNSPRPSAPPQDWMEGE